MTPPTTHRSLERANVSHRLWLLTFALASIAVAADSNSTLQSEMEGVLRADPRNAGIDVVVRSDAGRSTLLYDLKAISMSKSAADVFRVLLQFARAERSRSFKSVELAFRGQVRFRIAGEYFSQLGDEYGTQNAVYTMRTFTENVFRPDGSSAYPKWSGGLLGVATKQIDQFNEFHREWFMGDLIREAVEHNTATLVNPAPAPQISQVVQGSDVVTAPTVSTEPLVIPDWLVDFAEASNPAKAVSPTAVDLSYSVRASTEAVVSHYEQQLRSPPIKSLKTFDGIGTSIRATDGKESCVVRIVEDSGTRVKINCSRADPTSSFPALLVPPTPTTPTAPPQGLHTVEYSISGSADYVGITARNSEGGTEQHEVGLPYHRTLYVGSGQFVYLSAQNKGKDGDVHVTIRVDGNLLQEASASSPYGIATASGSVRR
jgi:hypothetical protein